MGSVKDLKIIKEPTEKSLGIGRFAFSDRYSIFDWGEMPDHIPNKGEALTLLAAYFFEKLEERGIPTHYIGLVEDGDTKKLSDLRGPVNTLEIELLRVIKPELRSGQYDYSRYQDEKGGFLIPLEIIYRNFLPEGSTIFSRLKKGEIKPNNLGLDRMPVPGQKLNTPFIDVSTKLEITDRYLSWEEAKQISGLSDNEIDELKNLTNTINVLISEEFEKIGLTNEDGKIECGFDMNRRLLIVDVLGTLDECRFTLDGLPVSKEIARIFYRNTDWYGAVLEAKKKSRQCWKEICRRTPQPLPEGLKLAISQVYCACANKITKKEWFDNIPPLNEILKEIKGKYGHEKVC